MIDLQVDDRGVARLALDRAEKHNALSQTLIDALRDAAATIAADKDIRVVVLCSTGPSFCAGGDLGWMCEQMAGDAAMKRAAAQSIAGMLGALNTLPQPVIGRIHGNAFGGGVGMACVCDIAIAADHARFGLTETKLGLIPARSGPTCWPGWARRGRGRCLCRAVYLMRPRQSVWGLLRAVCLQTNWMAQWRQKWPPIWPVPLVLSRPPRHLPGRWAR